ncbi:hypothetical protein [Lyngbya confervoides]|uniref:Uncharacterized protein n=1 Tax=Lyngbya confervoides BDU141951 TaxID=1574623 RepID=A0ABD4T0M7_9CYAN|nr:hypothetical protein [Lyngbya confervoides]MCM1982326.1 hypothetical protein [Lyngbya confervoides BDU141951]
MNTARLVKIASLSTLFAGALTLPALAGSTYVENDYSIRNIYKGRNTTNVNIDTNYKFDRHAVSKSTKDGTTWTETKQKSSGHVDGLWQEQSFREVDDFEISATSKSTETGWGSTKEKVRVHDTYNYNGIDKTHRVTSGFDF